MTCCSAQTARYLSFIITSILVGLTGQMKCAKAQVEGKWTGVIQLQNNPVAAVLLNNGKVLTWSSNNQLTFEDDVGNSSSQTYTSLFTPSTSRSVVSLVTNTLSDMFCPGIALLQDGRVLVNGGSSSPNTNIYNPAFNRWAAAATMNIPRGYNGDVVLTDGLVLTLGGSWSGALDEKIGEAYDQSNNRWTLKPGITAQPITGPDPEDAADGYVFRGDNHPWLFAVRAGLVFHAGPSAQMNWITTDGDGSIFSAGNRGDDSYSMTGVAVMYDVGMIFKTGGAPAYQYANATADTFVININAAVANPVKSPVEVKKTASMAYPRSFANGVLLPNGQILVVGGQTYAVPFSDDNAVLVPELWDPIALTFQRLAPMATPRVYHSVALLLPDGRVFVGGGGLCGDCGTNHENAEIFSPPYLFNADGTSATRPQIKSAPSQAFLGSNISVTTSTSSLSFVLVRMSATTHGLNNDQRRIPLSGLQPGTTHTLSIPSDPGTVPRGYYMLFALNGHGTPSVAKTILIE